MKTKKRGLSSHLWIVYKRCVYFGHQIPESLQKDFINQASIKQLQSIDASLIGFDTNALKAFLDPENEQKFAWAVKCEVISWLINFDVISNTNDWLIKQSTFKHLSILRGNIRHSTEFISWLMQRVDFYAWLVKQPKCILWLEEISLLIEKGHEQILLDYITAGYPARLPFSQCAEHELLASSMEAVKKVYLDNLSTNVAFSEITEMSCLAIIKEGNIDKISNMLDYVDIETEEEVDALVALDSPKILTKLIDISYDSYAMHSSAKFVEALIKLGDADLFRKFIEINILETTEAEMALIRSENVKFINIYLEKLINEDCELEDEVSNLLLNLDNEELKNSFIEKFNLPYQRELNLVVSGSYDDIKPYITSHKLYAFSEAYFFKRGNDQLIRLYLDNHFPELPGQIALSKYANNSIVSYYVTKLTSQDPKDDKIKMLNEEAWPFFLKKTTPSSFAELLNFFLSSALRNFLPELPFMVLNSGRWEIIEVYMKKKPFLTSSLTDFIKKGDTFAVLTYIQHQELRLDTEKALINRGDKDLCLAYIKQHTINKENVNAFTNIVADII